MVFERSGHRIRKWRLNLLCSKVMIAVFESDAYGVRKQRWWRPKPMRTVFKSSDCPQKERLWSPVAPLPDPYPPLCERNKPCSTTPPSCCDVPPHATVLVMVSKTYAHGIWQYWLWRQKVMLVASGSRGCCVRKSWSRCNKWLWCWKEMAMVLEIWVYGDRK